jgi:hypothetical protein
VDWSGARDAGARIWIARGEVRARGLEIAWVRRAADLPGSGVARERSVAALVRLISGARDAVVGLDFPFGLPSSLVGEKTWEGFALGFAARYRSPERFRRGCWRAAGRRETRRRTDLEARTPFSPWNLRLYRQTFYGIRDVLAPLVGGERAAVLPMQAPVPGRPRVVEICPASTLKREGLCRVRYKGASARDREAARGRQRVLGGIERAFAVSFRSPALRRSLLGDHRGDALDSVIAACAVRRALGDGALDQAPPGDPFRLEGRVWT